MSAYYNIASRLSVRGLKVLEKSRFDLNASFPIVKLNEKSLASATKLLKKYFLKLFSFKPVQTLDVSDSRTKFIALDPSKICCWQDIELDVRQKLSHFDITEKDFETREYKFSYDNWSYEDIFKAVLPEDQDNLSGFSKVGHIVHLNLREHLLDYKYLIGEVLHDKVSECRTVVNKTNNIDNTYRNFNMEVLYGDRDFNVRVKENKFVYEFNFSKVYWNPRLSSEHERIVGLLNSNDVLFDVFAGVGPFAVPAAKNKCFVYANDLNPDSYKWLNHNAKLNKVPQSLFNSYNMDGEKFIKEIVREGLISLMKERSASAADGKVHIVMNLPALAVDFLQYFNGILEDVPEFDRLNAFEPIVHVYCFVLGQNHTELAKQLVVSNLQHDLSDSEVDVFYVRNVAPNKEMLRVSFTLNKSVLFNTKLRCKRLLNTDEQSLKKNM